MAKSPEGAAVVLEESVLPTLKQHLQKNDEILNFRVLDLFSQLASLGGHVFEVVKRTQVLEHLFQKLETDDLLQQLNAIELLEKEHFLSLTLTFCSLFFIIDHSTSTSQSMLLMLIFDIPFPFLQIAVPPEGISFLSERGILNKLITFLKSDEPLLVSKTLSFFGFVGSRVCIQFISVSTFIIAIAIAIAIFISVKIRLLSIIFDKLISLFREILTSVRSQICP